MLSPIEKQFLKRRISSLETDQKKAEKVKNEISSSNSKKNKIDDKISINKRLEKFYKLEQKHKNLIENEKDSSILALYKNNLEMIHKKIKKLIAKAKKN